MGVAPGPREAGVRRAEGRDRRRDHVDVRQLRRVQGADEQGRRRGLLLPDIEGVDTARRQVEIASRKAGIPAGASVSLFRFSVQRFSEKPQERTAGSNSRI